MLKYFFESYGCQMNMAESAALSLSARERKWVEAKNAEDSDLVLINTCSVRATAEQRVFGRLSHYKTLKKRKNFTLVLAGCMAERLGENFRKDYPIIDYIMGTQSRSIFPLILQAVEEGKPFINTDITPDFSFSALHHNEDRDNPFRSYVPIMQGCNNFCSYCIVPYVRGREVSRSPDSILEEIELLSKKGVKEITLLGQNVNSWSYGGQDFPSLLELIANNLHEIKWVRFLTSHPKDFSPSIIKVLSEYSCFCRHIHLCVQHGSDRILSAMNRQYDSEQYLNLVDELKNSLPGLSLSTDILVGFPGETEEDFEHVLVLMEKVKFLYAYMYHFNPREGTAAYSLPDRVDEETKKKRLSRVISLQHKHGRQILRARIGCNVDVLIEGISRKNADELIGRTERNETVVFPGKAKDLGSFGKVRLSSLKGNTFRSDFCEIL